MKEYEITIEELLSKSVRIKAKDEYEADEIARKMYKSGEIMLYADDCYQVNMMVSREEENYYSDWTEI